MNEIRIEFSIGPKESDQEISGSYHFQTDNPDEAFVISALKKSIAKLQVTKETHLVGLFDVFINNVKTYEMGVLGIGKLLKTEIRRL